MGIAIFAIPIRIHRAPYIRLKRNLERLQYQTFALEGKYKRNLWKSQRKNVPRKWI